MFQQHLVRITFVWQWTGEGWRLFFFLTVLMWFKSLEAILERSIKGLSKAQCSLVYALSDKQSCSISSADVRLTLFQVDINEKGWREGAIKDSGWEQMLCLQRLSMTFSVYLLWFSSEKCRVCVTNVARLQNASIATVCFKWLNHKYGILRLVECNRVSYHFTKLQEHKTSLAFLSKISLPWCIKEVLHTRNGYGKNVLK